MKVIKQLVNKFLSDFCETASYTVRARYNITPFGNEFLFDLSRNTLATNQYSIYIIIMKLGRGAINIYVTDEGPEVTTKASSSMIMIRDNVPYLNDKTTFLLLYDKDISLTSHVLRSLYHYLKSELSTENKNVYRKEMCDTWNSFMSDYINSTRAKAVKKVIFNDPATIIYWNDNSKTVVKCADDDTYSKEIGVAMAILKKNLGDSYFNEIKKIVKKFDTEDNNK